MRPAALALWLLLGVNAAHADDIALLAEARAFVAPIGQTACANGTIPPGGKVYPMRYRNPGQDQDSPDFRLDLIEIPCGTRDQAGAIFVTRNPVGGQLALVSFAVPKLDYDYTDESFSTLKTPPRITGFSTTYVLVDPHYNSLDNSITSRHPWNSTGDAWSEGSWRLSDGSFILDRYVVDPTFAARGVVTHNNDQETGFTVFYSQK